MAWPLLGFLAWRDGGLDFSSPMFLVISLFVTVSGPLQTAAAWRLATPEIRQHPWWFVGAGLANLFAYTELKNLVNRVAHLKQLRGEHQWVVTPRTARAPPPAPCPTSPASPRRWPHDHAHSPERPRTDPDRAARLQPQFPVGWLRGLAALTVLTFHAYQHNRTGAESAWPWSGAAHQAMLGTDLFVDMFFVLSGFVLWLTVARATIDGRTGRPGWVLLFRRMARLLPLYYTIVIVVWAVTNPSLPGHWQDLLLHLTLHSRLQRPVHLLGRRPRVVARSRVPLLRADGTVGAAGARRSSTYDDPAGQARRGRWSFPRS